MGEGYALTDISDYEKQLDETIAKLQNTLDDVAMRRHKLETSGIVSVINGIKDYDVIRKWKPMTDHIRGYQDNSVLVLKVSRNLEIMNIILDTQDIPNKSVKSIIMPLIARYVEYA